MELANEELGMAPSRRPAGPRRDLDSLYALAAAVFIAVGSWYCSRSWLHYSVPWSLPCSWRTRSCRLTKQYARGSTRSSPGLCWPCSWRWRCSGWP